MLSYSKRVDHSLEAKVDFSGTDNLGDILFYVSAGPRENKYVKHTLGSLGSRRATLMPSSLK